MSNWLRSIRDSLLSPQARKAQRHKLPRKYRAQLLLESLEDRITPALNFAAATSVGLNGGLMPLGMAVGDFNGDSKADLVTANFSTNDLSVLLGDGSGGFGPATNFALTGTQPLNVVVGYLNADSFLDLVVTLDSTGSSNDLNVLLGNGTGGFGAAVAYNPGSLDPRDAQVADISGDGNLDIVTVPVGLGIGNILNGNGLGGFGSSTAFGVAAGTNRTSLTLADFNGDTKADIAVTDAAGGTVSVALNNGAGFFGAFTSYTVGSDPVFVTTGDFNGDTKLDLVTANSAGASVSVLLGDGSGGFGTATTISTTTAVQSVAVGDFDGDGKVDLAVAKSTTASVGVLLGDGSGGFAAPVDFAVGTNPRSVVAAHFNSGGQLDIAVTNAGSNNVSVLLNSTPTPSLSATLSGGNLTITDTDATGKNNNLTISRSGTNLIISDSNEFFASAPSGGTLSNGNKTLTFDTSVTTITTLTINGLGGNDTLTVDYTGGDPIPTGGLSFDGGAPTTGPGDKLRIIGTGVAAVYTPDAATTGNGILTINGKTISFSALEPVDFDVTSGSFTLSLPGLADNVTIADGFLTDGTTPALVLSGTSGGVAFETAHVRNTSSLTIDTTVSDGSDTITINSASTAHGNAGLSIVTGSSGTDVLTVNGTVTLTGTFSATGLEDVNLNAAINAASVTGNAANVDVTAPGQIQDAIDLAASGATVNVAAGSYTGGILVNRTLTISGTGSPTVTAANLNGQEVAFQIAADNVILQGFSITGTDSQYGVLLSDKPSGPAYTNGTVQNNQFTNLGYAIATADGAVDFTNSIIQNNNITVPTTGGWGIYLQSGSGHQVYGNTLSGTSTGAGFLVQGTSNVTIGGTGVGQGNMFSGLGSAVIAVDTTDNSFVGNTVTGMSGISGAVRLEGGVNGFSITQNSITGGAVPAVLLRQNYFPAPNSNVVVNNNTLTGNTYGIRVDVDGLSGVLDARYNNISGNSTANVLNDSTELVDVSGSYLGSSSLAAVSATILGTGPTDYTPFLNSGTDTSAAVGFQGDFSNITVHTSGAQNGATGRIQEAINLLADGSLTGGNRVIDVKAGTYVENVTVNKAVTLQGPNAGILGTGSRVGEAIIQTSASMIAPVNNAVVLVTASNVTIKGFKIDGDDPTVAGLAPLASGSDSNAQQGISNRVFSPSSTAAISNLRVENNIVTHVAVGVLGQSPSGASLGNVITGNWFDDIGRYDFGYAVSLRNNFYADVTNNKMSQTWVGVNVQNFSLAGPASLSLSDNDIDSYAAGMWLNLIYANAAPFIIDNNDIDAEALAVSGNFGVLLTTAQNNVSITYTDNVITGTDFGFVLWNNNIDPVTATITLDSSNSIVNSDTGVYVSNNIATVAPIGTTPLTTSTPGGNANVILDGISITGSTVAAVRAEGVSGAGFGNVNVTVQNDAAIVGTGVGTGILVQGPKASATIQNNDASIHGFAIGIDVNAGSASITNNSIYDNTTGIRVTNSGTLTAFSSNTFDDPNAATEPDGDADNGTDLRIDASAGTVTIGANNAFAGDTYYIDNRSSQSYNLVGSGTTFDETGVTPAADDNFRIEDKLFHALDSSASGLIRYVTNNLYVTTPGTGASDESVQRAVDAASGTDTINIETGTFVEATVTINSTKAGLTILGIGTVNVQNGFSLSSGANNVTIKDLNVTGGSGAAITAAGVSGLLLENLDLTNNTGVGISATGLSGITTLTDVVITGNSAGGSLATSGTLLVNGSSAADTFNVTPTTFAYNGGQTVNYSGATSLTFDGRAAADTYTVTYGTLPAPINLVDSGISGTDAAILNGTNLADTFAVNNLQTTRGAEAVNYTNVETVTVNGLDGDDTFNVTPTPLAGPQLFINGGNPPSSPAVLPGDILNINPYPSGGIVTPAGAGNGTLTSATTSSLTWTSIEQVFSVPFVTAAFDFNNGTPTQPFYIGVNPSKLYNTFTGHGWVGAGGVGGFDRGVPDSLIRDGHYGGYGSAPKVFQVDMTTPGETYFVTLYMGDASYNQGPVSVKVVGGGDALTGDDAANDFLIKDATLTAGQFLVRTFQVKTNGLGQLQLQFSASGTSVWVVNGLDVRPADMTAPLTLTRQDAVALTTAQEADGYTIDEYQGTGATPGALVQLTTTGGAIVQVTNAAGNFTGPVVTDAHPNYAGVQVQADASGNFGFRLRRPTGSAAVELQAFQVNGLAAGTAIQSYKLPTVRNIDFNLNTNSGVTPAGYVAFAPALYTSTGANAIGWVTSTTGGFDRGGSNLLLRDGQFGNSSSVRIFEIDVADFTATYALTVTAGDLQYAVGPMSIQVVGGGDALTGDNPASEFLLQNVSIAAGQFLNRTFQVKPNVSTGKLQLQFSGTGTWVINALELRPLDTVGTITLTPPGGSVPVNTPFTVTGSGATANTLVTVTTTLGTFVGTDASTLYQGFQVLSDAGGNFSFQVTTAKAVGGNPITTLTAEEITGARKGTATQTIAYLQNRRFDFDDATNVVAAGFEGIRANSNFATTGIGWLQGVLEYSRSTASATPVALYKDGHYGPSGAANAKTLQIRVEAGQTYNLRLYLGDQLAKRDFVEVMGEGGSFVTTPVTNAGSFAQFTLTGTDVNNDGILLFTIRDTGGTADWTLDGMDVSFGALPALPLTAGLGAGASTGSVTVDQVQALYAEAQRRWGQSGISAEQQQLLLGTQLVVADLAPGLLGLASPGVVQIDVNAAGRGWYVDSTPADDSEFSITVAATEKQAAYGSAAATGIDLLTVLMHEMGHLLGGVDLDPASVPHSLMTDTLNAGVRRLPTPEATGTTPFGQPAALDAVFTAGAPLHAATAADWTLLASGDRAALGWSATPSVTAAEALPTFATDAALAQAATVGTGNQPWWARQTDRRPADATLLALDPFFALLQEDDDQL